MAGLRVKRQRNRGFIHIKSNEVFSFPKLPCALLECGEELNLCGRAADHSPPFSEEIKNAWNLTAIGTPSFFAWCFILAINFNKHRKHVT